MIKKIFYKNYYSDIVTIKYNSSGTQQWVSRINGNNNTNDAGKSILFDGTDVWIRKSNYLQLQKLISDQVNEFNELFLKVSNSVEIEGVRKRLYERNPNEMIYQWTKSFQDVIKTTDRQKFTLKVLNTLKSRRLETDKDIFNFFALRQTVSVFYRIINLSPRDRCFSAYLFCKLSEELMKRI